MMKITLIGLMGLCILMSGCKSTPQKVVYSPSECVPDIQIIKEPVKVDPELTQTYENPVPSTGENGILLVWCLTEAANNRELNAQMEAIRKIH